MQESGQKNEGAGSPEPLFQPLTPPSVVQTAENLLQTIDVETLRFRQGLEAVRSLVQAFLAGGLRHPRVHVGVPGDLVGHCRFEV